MGKGQKPRRFIPRGLSGERGGNQGHVVLPQGANTQDLDPKVWCHYPHGCKFQVQKTRGEQEDLKWS